MTRYQFLFLLDFQPSVQVFIQPLFQIPSNGVVKVAGESKRSGGVLGGTLLPFFVGLLFELLDNGLDNSSNNKARMAFRGTHSRFSRCFGEWIYYHFCFDCKVWSAFIHINIITFSRRSR